jgi:DNA-binding FadR family transcriptional regulator
MNGTGFTIDKVEWHTRVANNPESVDAIHHRFWVVIDFLQKNHLVNEVIVESKSLITDLVSIHTSNLNEKGVEVMKKYHTWLKAVDKGKSSDDITMFYKELNRLEKKSHL